jgi:hypothetical protein
MAKLQRRLLVEWLPYMFLIQNYFLSDDQGLSDHSSITDVSFYGVDAPSPSYIDSFNSAYPESCQSDSYRPDNDYRSYESSQLNTRYESSQVNAHYETSQLNTRYESSQVNAHYETSQINARYESSQVNAHYETSQLNARYESSQLNTRYESSQINAHYESSHLNAHYESSELTEHHHRPKHYRDTPENEPKLINMKRPKLIVPLITITPVDGPEQEFVFEDEEIYAMFNRPIKEKQAFADSHNIELDDNNETFPVEGTRLFDSPE